MKFYRQIYPQLREKYKGKSLAVVSKEIGMIWRELNEEEKQKYKNEFEKE